MLADTCTASVPDTRVENAGRVPVRFRRSIFVYEPEDVTLFRGQKAPSVPSLAGCSGACCRERKPVTSIGALE